MAHCSADLLNASHLGSRSIVPHRAVALRRLRAGGSARLQDRRSRHTCKASIQQQHVEVTIPQPPPLVSSTGGLSTANIYIYPSCPRPKGFCRFGTRPPCVDVVSGGWQDDLLDGLPSSDAFAELVRMALEKDPSLPPVPSSAAARAASGVVGPSPEAAAGTKPAQKTCFCSERGDAAPTVRLHMYDII